MTNILDLLTLKEKEMIKTKTYQKEKTIFYEDDMCDSIGIIINGEVDILSYSYHGKEIVYNTLRNGELFGNNLIFSDKPFFRGNVIAKSQTSIAFINKQSLLNILQNNEKFLLEYLRIQSNFGKGLNARIKMMTLESAEDRFMYFLHLNNNEYTYKSITSLAIYLNLARETLSRLLTKLKKENKIAIVGKKIQKEEQVDLKGTPNPRH